MRPGGQHRRIDRAKVAAALKQLEALFGGLKKDNAHGKVGEIGKAKNSNDTVTQPATNWQGWRDE